jgi:hypothetical protein
MILRLYLVPTLATSLGGWLELFGPCSLQDLMDTCPTSPGTFRQRAQPAGVHTAPLGFRLRDLYKNVSMAEQVAEKSRLLLNDRIDNIRTLLFI